MKYCENTVFNDINRCLNKKIVATVLLNVFNNNNNKLTFVKCQTETPKRQTGKI